MCYGLGAVVFAALIASMFKTPNSTIKVLIISWIGLIILSIKSPPSHSRLQAYLFSLNINTAFRYAAKSIAEFMNRDRVLGWLNIFEDAPYMFSCGEAFLMIIFDIFWMVCMMFVFDRVFGQPDFSLRDFFSCYSPANCESDSIDGASAAPLTRRYDRNEIQSISTSSEDTSFPLDSIETDYRRARTEGDINVKGLVKIYSETGETAVAGLTLNAAKGEVTVLLGHNGAGKSTILSAISGIIAPTAGKIRICDCNVQTYRNEIRKIIGLCPQHNPLYEKLTVKEHLWLVHGLKGADRSGYAAEEKYLLEETKLDEKGNEKAMNLSGGMKRKLCVCMALIGKSPVVLLDEPTAGLFN
ncbi:hypothetical protein WR25_25876 [Diploscapter pachys]|uniref:ABC transporter domain-containing protein n=1 Tax=Diploscapter pachys TaxID=2018661 RepID=A0A2A2J5B6_9BILA|nr:hypothetical protein WR25_25876 [Diploscapter pachys]